MNTTYKLNPVPWKLSGDRITRHFNNGDLICNVGVYDLFTGMDEGKFVGNLFIGTNWNPYKEAIIAIFMAEEMKFLERCISAVGERFSYSAYMIADEFTISVDNELCNNKKFENGIEVNVTGGLFQFVITVSFPHNPDRKLAFNRNEHEVVVKVKDAKLVYPIIHYLTTTEGVGPNP